MSTDYGEWTLVLALILQEHGSSIQQQKVAPMYRDSQTRRQSVLIVEDDAQMAYLLEFILSREGFDVVLASDGKQALAHIESISPPSLVLLDVMLPYMDGFELLQHIRTRADWRSVPVIMVTGRSHVRDIVHAFEIGANDYIIKPFQPGELLARLKRFLTVAA